MIFRWRSLALIGVLSGLALSATGCASVRNMTMPATYHASYDLHTFTVKPPADPNWRLLTYDRWNPFALFQHADTGDKMGAWWVAVTPEEMAHSKSQTAVEFFRDAIAEQMKYSGDYEIPDSGWEEHDLDVGGVAYRVLHMKGRQGEGLTRKVPFEGWLVYRSTGTDAAPRLEIFSYVRSANSKSASASTDPLSDLKTLLQGVVSNRSESRWVPRQRAMNIHNRFLARHGKQGVSTEQPRLLALYQAAQREAQLALLADPHRWELHDLAGLLACYNKDLEFLGEGFSAAAAEKAFQKALEIRPNFELGRTHLANMYKALDQKDKALAQYQILSEISPVTAEYYYQQGKLLDQLQRTDEARAAYQKALRFWMGATETRKELEDRVNSTKN